jgi:hypothetical protein
MFEPWQAECECCTTLRVLHRAAAAVRFRDRIDDGEAETDASLGARARSVGSSEALEDLSECFSGDTFAAVCNLDDDVAGGSA